MIVNAYFFVLSFKPNIFINTDDLSKSQAGASEKGFLGAQTSDSAYTLLRIIHMLELSSVNLLIWQLVITCLLGITAGRQLSRNLATCGLGQQSRS